MSSHRPDPAPSTRRPAARAGWPSVVLAPLLAAGLAACTAWQDRPPGEEPADWANPRFWEGTAFDAILLPTSLPSTPHWQVRIATSTDLVRWEPDPRVIAVHLSSLDLAVVGSRLLIAGMPAGDFLRGLGPLPTTAFFPLLSTTDLETWGIAGVPIHQASQLFPVDPSLRLSAAGVVEAHWFGHSVRDVDPADVPGLHGVYRATWTDRLREQSPPAPIFEAPTLADPVVCHFGQREWLFWTSQTRLVKAAVSEDGGRSFHEVPGFDWQGPSVPHCTVHGDRLYLVAQVEGGMAPPMVARMAPDGTIEQVQRLFDPHLWDDDCSSPVLGRFRDRWVLACAVRVHHAPATRRP